MTPHSRFPPESTFCLKDGFGRLKHLTTGYSKKRLKLRISIIQITWIFRYRQCVNGFWHTRECNPGTVFDVSTLKCGHRHLAWGCGLKAENAYKKQVADWIALAEEAAKEQQVDGPTTTTPGTPNFLQLKQPKLRKHLSWWTLESNAELPWCFNYLSFLTLTLPV